MPSPDPSTTPDASPRAGDSASGRRLHALTQIAAVGFVALLLVVAATATGAWELNPAWEVEGPSTTDAPPPPPATGVPSQTPSPDVPFDSDDVPTPDLTWLAVVVSVIVAAVLLLVLLRVLAYLRRPRAEDLPDPGTSADYGEEEPEPDLPALHEGVRHAVEQLRAVGPPRDAIVSAWLAMEEAADRSGVHRRPAQTPTEHAAAVLARTGADSEATDTLLHLYHRARFSNSELGRADVDRAGRALEALAASWPELARGSSSSPAEPATGADR
ncbi:DUF4129 domain-containing protein [Ruania zhangjianzhongii]|uniref:DUF4129 domain-containing protein n=1 Tax=Ruania zhangjianzhongii TaxID=2603206 RepID=UPI0011C7BE9B|nr:DUF4129 domain-containing protein [Ruania zhangjianzhongii]